MKKFSLTETCPKCGGMSYRVKYMIEPHPDGKIYEYMDVCCQTCGCEFRRAPLDSPDIKWTSALT